LVVPARNGRVDAVQAALQEVKMKELPVPPDTAVRLPRRRVNTGLKMRDCCVPLADEDSHATVATFDDQLVRAAEGRNLVVLRR